MGPKRPLCVRRVPPKCPVNTAACTRRGLRTRSPSTPIEHSTCGPATARRHLHAQHSHPIALVAGPALVPLPLPASINASPRRPTSNPFLAAPFYFGRRITTCINCCSPLPVSPSPSPSPSHPLPVQSCLPACLSLPHPPRASPSAQLHHHHPPDPISFLHLRLFCTYSPLAPFSLVFFRIRHFCLAAIFTPHTPPVSFVACLFRLLPRCCQRPNTISNNVSRHFPLRGTVGSFSLIAGQPNKQPAPANTSLVTSNTSIVLLLPSATTDSNPRPCNNPPPIRSCRSRQFSSLSNLSFVIQDRSYS